MLFKQRSTDVAVQVVCEVIRQIPQTLLQDFTLITENQLIIPSGWTSHKYGSHLISLFYEKIPNKLYKLTIFNSGLGINQNHEKINDKYNISRTITTNENQTIQIISLILLINMHDSDLDFYYGKIINEFGFKKNYTDDDDDYDLRQVCEQEDQLSGSCTFYGYYYNLFYILQKNELKIDLFKKNVIEYSQNNLLNYYCEKKYITNLDKDFINLLILSLKDFDNKNVSINKIKQQVSLSYNENINLDQELVNFHLTPEV